MSSQRNLSREPMGQALRLADRATAISPPNPSVGCVITDVRGTVLGEGFTQAAGGPHAEVIALRDAAARGNAVHGGIAYVSLEPCSHHGRTGPCCEALIAAGIRKVVASIEDPNPQVAGQGFARLRAAGIQVEVGRGAQQSRELNLGFFSRMIRKTPWVRLKIAASLDGRTALPNGRSQWITSPEARIDGHRWRARAGALLTGVGTVLQDDPRLDVRLPEAVPRQPPLVVVDSRLQLSPQARVFDAPRPVWIYSAREEEARAAALQVRGATVTCLPNAQGKVDLAAMLADLARREVNDLHVEAGHQLNGSLIREGAVDELLLYLAPRLLGEGMAMASQPFAGGPLQDLAGAIDLDFQSFEQIGPDLRIVARIRGRDRF